MALRHGKNAALTISSQNLTAYCENIDFSVDVDTADTTVFGATWKSALAGIPSGRLDVSGFYDPTATVAPPAVFWAAISGGVPVTGVFYPGGNTSGQTSWTMTSGCLVTSYNETSTVSGAVAFTASIEIVVLPVRATV